MKSFKINYLTALLLTVSIAFAPISGCKKWSKTAKGGAIGAAAGGAVGAAIGHQSGNTATGAILGAAIGGAAGAIIGNYMDKQAEEMRRDMENAKIERVGEGIKITFESGILFNVDSYDLKSTSRDNVNDLAKIVQKYDDTNILIEGHTDNTGSKEHNQTLSERRAKSVADQLKAQGVSGGRISTVGYGEDQPVDDNSTETGKQQNRRVEIAIFANEKLKKAAERGELE